MSRLATIVAGVDAALASIERADLVLFQELQALVDQARGSVTIRRTLALALAVKRNADAQLHARVAALREEVSK